MKKLFFFSTQYLTSYMSHYLATAVCLWCLLVLLVHYWLCVFCYCFYVDLGCLLCCLLYVLIYLLLDYMYSNSLGANSFSSLIFLMLQNGHINLILKRKYILQIRKKNWMYWSCHPLGNIWISHAQNNIVLLK